MSSFEELVADPPLLHYWRDQWELGGISVEMARVIARTVEAHAPHGALRVIETGAGFSTLLFLALGAEIVTSIAPEPPLLDRIADSARERALPADRLDGHADFSELVLPRLFDGGAQYNVALIDGGHGWPTVFVDFCYLNAMLVEGGLMFIDDLQLHSVRQLYLQLRSQPGFEVVQKLGEKMIGFRKTSADRFLPDFRDQPFILSNSDI